MINFSFKKMNRKVAGSFSYGRAYMKHFEDALKNLDWYTHQEKSMKKWSRPSA
jgi:hypothetical protein